VAYPISYRRLEETIEQQFRAHKRPLGSSWPLDETYVKVKSAWK
jgi:transposase-like protein